jgi:hypothetical protein
MEHIVQFGISFDDKKITQAVEEKAEKVLFDDLKQKINDNLFEHDYYNRKGNPKNGFSHWMECHVIAFLEQHKQEIIEMTGRLIAEKLSRTKAARELLKED